MPSSVESVMACCRRRLAPERCLAAITGDEPPPLGLRSRAVAPFDAARHVDRVGAVDFVGGATVGELDHRRAVACRLPCSVSMTGGSG